MHSILALALTAQTAFATSFYIRPFSEFTKSTQNIIRGKTSEIHAQNVINPDGSKAIYTFAKLEIKDVIKGDVAGTQIQIRKLGGTIDGVTLDIPSSVEFKDNEDGVFFLSVEQEDRSFEVSGMELGKFNLKEKNGEEILIGGIFSYSTPEPANNHDHNVMADNISENLKPWSIHQLKDLVKSQQQSSPPVAETQKSAEISRPTAEISSSPTITPRPESVKTISTSEEKENSPLYFNATVWYSIATIVLTLGVFWLFRRG